MEITCDFGGRLDEFIDIAYGKYSREVARHSFLEKRSEASFAEFFMANSTGMKRAAIFEGGELAGFMLYALKEGDGGRRCDIPVWGYGARGERPARTLGYLFQRLAERVVSDGNTDFTVHLYAHDDEIHRLFSYTQFGIISEVTVRRISEIAGAGAARVREMPKDELARRWDEVWGLLSRLIGHLKESPVFYPCVEFTEELYKGFMFDAGTALYAAEDGERIIGIIESNPERRDLIFESAPCANVGESYVLPEYRGRGIAQALLKRLEEDLISRNIACDWVEHGTANPTARGFWNKYFETFEYVFVRSVRR